ncbi:GntR family transcriptional regulator [Salinibacterium sp. UTAS2018]|uniref:GntR family transcriptional regulator n=1 Tax=Salinibacterium sp. UTAS2018 TaxID=2508880 RepID=UPI0010093E92|nr:GntR family transcriptional regulator [Salinibacterium sp. UTAS2018]QAV71065.1 GntR family transcriptional regulator [Salinibacterium sp. UTAS2018]
MEITVPEGRIVTGSLTEDERILSGVLRHVREAARDSNFLLPGELKLAEWLNCSRPQVRVALAQLERQGIVIRSQGAATVVDPVALRLSARFEASVSYGEVLARMGYTPSVEILTAETIELPADLAPLLSPLSTTRAVKIVLRWYADDQAAMVAEYTIPLPAGEHDPINPTDPVYESAKNLWGEGIAWEIVTAGVALLDDNYADLLQLDKGTEAKMWETIGVTLSGERIFYALEHHHPTLVMYSFVRTMRAPWSAIPGH